MRWLRDRSYAGGNGTASQSQHEGLKPLGRQSFIIIASLPRKWKGGEILPRLGKGYLFITVLFIVIFFLSINQS